MGKLVQFTLTEERPAREIEKPPKDPLERAHWVHSVLCEGLHEVLNDGGLLEEERHDLTLKYAAKIVSATPHNDLHAARQDLRSREKRTAASAVGGAVKHGAVSKSGSLRSSAPKRGRSK